jgi:hypothetical protein
MELIIGPLNSHGGTGSDAVQAFRLSARIVGTTKPNLIKTEQTFRDWFPLK